MHAVVVKDRRRPVLPNQNPGPLQSKRIDSLLSALRAALPEMHRAVPFVTCAQVQSSFTIECICRFCWLAASSTPVCHFPYQSIVKVDIRARRAAEWHAPDGCFVGEPLFVARTRPAQTADASGSGSHAGTTSEVHNGSSTHQQGPTDALDEDDGYVVTLMHNARHSRSSLVILDARDPAAGPLALVHLRRALPFAFHCLWSSEYHGPC